MEIGGIIPGMHKQKVVGNHSITPVVIRTIQVQVSQKKNAFFIWRREDNLVPGYLILCSKRIIPPTPIWKIPIKLHKVVKVVISFLLAPQHPPFVRTRSQSQEYYYFFLRLSLLVSSSTSSTVAGLAP
jgi:hypothetical protein